MTNYLTNLDTSVKNKVIYKFSTYHFLVLKYIFKKFALNNLPNNMLLNDCLWSKKQIRQGVNCIHFEIRDLMNNVFLCQLQIHEHLERPLEIFGGQ